MAETATHRLVPVDPEDDLVESVASVLAQMHLGHWQSLTELQRDKLREDVRWVYAALIGDWP
jgi:hypothetical protein